MIKDTVEDSYNVEDPWTKTPKTPGSFRSAQRFGEPNRKERKAGCLTL